MILSCSMGLRATGYFCRQPGMEIAENDGRTDDAAKLTDRASPASLRVSKLRCLSLPRPLRSPPYRGPVPRFGEFWFCCCLPLLPQRLQHSRNLGAPPSRAMYSLPSLASFRFALSKAVTLRQTSGHSGEWIDFKLAGLCKNYYPRG